MAKKKKKVDENNSVLATNRKARHDYHIIDTWEAGVVLLGTEIKSLREGKVSLVDSFATIDNGEIWLQHLHIPQYSMGSWTNHTPKRTRKLLLSRRELDKLESLTARQGYTIVPLALYWKECWVKVEIGLVKGKKEHDKREDTKAREWDREKARIMKNKHRG